MTGITAANKVYDGTTSATISTANASLVGVMPGDAGTVTLVTSGVGGAFTDKNVGTGKAVNISGLTLTGSAASNYALSQPSTTANITAALAIVALNAATLTTTYDGVPNVVTATTTPGGLTVVVTYNGSSTAPTRAGSYAVSVAVSDGNYTGSTNGTLTINPAPVTVIGITAANKPYDGTTGATINASGATLNGIFPVDAANVILVTSGATGNFSDTSPGVGKIVAINGLALSGSAAGNYTLAPPTTTANITPAPALTVTGITAVNKVYDGSTSATINAGGATLSGVPLADVGKVTLVSSGATGTFTDKNVGAGKTVTISGLSLTGSAAGNYTLVSPTAAASITPANLSVIGVGAANKVYDGTTSASINASGATLNGVLAVDTGNVSLGISGATGTFADKNVGTGKTVNVSGLALSGSAAVNYTLALPTTTANITPAAVTVTGITAANKTYDGTASASINLANVALGGVLGPDLGNVILVTSGATGTFGDPSVGTGKPVTISGLSLSGSAAGNYTLTPPTTTASITAVGALTVTGITAANKVYDGTTAATINTNAATLNGVPAADVRKVGLVISGATGTFADRNAGTGKTVTIGGLSLTGIAAGNYTLAPPTATASIMPASVAVIGITAANKAYDGTTSSSINANSAALSGVLTVDTGNVSLGTSGATGAFVDKNVGTGQAVTVSGLALTGNAAGNYALTPPTATANITPAALTVTGITAANKIYDGTSNASINASGAALVGVVAADTGNVSLVLGGGTGTFVDRNVANAKVVTITGLALAGTASGNYTLVTPTATANITPAALTVTGITATSKVYDGTTSVTISTLGAVLNGVAPVDIGNVTLVTSGATGAFVDSGVGTGKTVTIRGLALAGSAAGNYSLTPPISTANITPPGALTATGITAVNKVYDGATGATLNTGGATLNGVAPADIGNVTLVTTAATGTFADRNVGTGKTVSVSGLSLGGSAAGNYTVAAPTTTASITPAGLSVVGLTAANKQYDGTTTATLITSGAALNGVLPIDAGNVVLVSSGATGGFADKNVGLVKSVAVSGLALSGSAAGNYSLASPTVTANVTPLILTVTGITAANKVYDGTTSASVNVSGATLNGVLSMDGGNVGPATGGVAGAFTDPNVGVVKTVTITGLALVGNAAGNYSLAAATATANITPRTLTVNGVTAANKVYDGSTSANINLNGATLIGVLAADLANVSLGITGATGTFADRNVGAGKLVRVGGLTLTGSAAGNYTLAPPTAVANVTTLALSVTGITAASKVHDGTTSASVNTSGAVLNGVAAVDTGNVTLVTNGASGAFVDSSVGIGKTVMISGLLLSGTAAGNYTLTPPTTTANITPPGALTVTGILAVNKVYDGTTTATINASAATLDGVPSADVGNVSLVISGATGTFADKNVGTGKTITVGGLSLAGSAAGNYTLAPPTATANITPASLTASGITAASKVYDGTASANITAGGAALSGVLSVDAGSVTLSMGGATGTFADKNVGTGNNVTITGLALSGAAAGNYTLTSPTVVADITPKSVTVVGITVASKIYDGTTSASVNFGAATLVGALPADSANVSLLTSGASGAFADSSVGTGKTVTISGLGLSGTAALNYVLIQPILTADIVAGLQIVVNGRSYAANSSAVLTNSPSVEFRGALPVGATIHYTLDGRTPDYSSPLYTNPFFLTNGYAALRAVEYSSNFSKTNAAGPVYLFRLTAITLGGGAALANVVDSTTPSNAVARVTAQPQPPWNFLYWRQDASGTSPTVNITMNGPKTVEAVFGTDLQTTVVGPGSLLLIPSQGPYPYGSDVTLRAQANPGNYFYGWSDALSGSLNPMDYRVLQPQPSVVSLFYPLSPNQLTLTVLTTGAGEAAVNPAQNVYTNGQVVLLSATADPWNTFVRWTGLTNTATNPLSLALQGSQTNLYITARFATNTAAFAFSTNQYVAHENNSNAWLAVLSKNSQAGQVVFTTRTNNAVEVDPKTEWGDYWPSNGVLTFSAGVPTQSFAIVLQQHHTPLPDRSFFVDLLQWGTTNVLDTASVLIIDDVPQPPLCFTNRNAPGPGGGDALQVTLSPSHPDFKWRLDYERGWRFSDEIISGLDPGWYNIKIKPVAGYDTPALQTVLLTNNEPTFDFQYTYTSNAPPAANGSLTVRIKGLASSVSAQGQWQFVDEGAAWHADGDKLSNLAAGEYLIQFSDVPGYVTPPSQPVLIGSKQANSVTVYYEAQTASPTKDPALVTTSLLANPLTDPYAYCGQITADDNVFASGCAVMENVVLTAAHVVFNEATLTNRLGLTWLYLRDTAKWPPALIPRGWYMLSGYAAQQATETNGLVSNKTRDLDAAALYFLEPVARGGYSGYLISGPSDCGTNYWLLQQTNKILVGYPFVKSNNGKDFGRMYASGVVTASFANETNRVYSTTNMVGYPGSSGGPLCVQCGDVYYPAAIYSGMTQDRAIFCAIDSAVAQLIMNAASTADTGVEHVGGGPIMPDTGLVAATPGQLTVQLGPPEALAAGAGWRLQGVGPTNYFTNAQWTIAAIAPSNYVLEFKPVLGFGLPTDNTVEIFAGQEAVKVISYSASARFIAYLTNRAALQLIFNGPASNTYIIETTTNLATGTNLTLWLPLRTNVLGSDGTWFFMETNLTKDRLRFYRARAVP